MFAIRPKRTVIDDAIDEVRSRMIGATCSAEEYSAMMNTFIQLSKLKNEENLRTLSPDVAITIAGNLIGIVLILNHERLHIITSKALGFVMRLK